MIVAQRFMPPPGFRGGRRLLGGQYVFTDDIDMEKPGTYEARETAARSDRCAAGWRGPTRQGYPIAGGACVVSQPGSCSGRT